LTSNESTVSTADRLSFTLFLAFVLHAALIVGITFTIPASLPQQQTLDITLVHNASEQPPDQADFIAQHQQQGSGSEHQSHKLQQPWSDRESVAHIQQQTAAPAAAPLDQPQTRPEIIHSTQVKLQDSTNQADNIHLIKPVGPAVQQILAGLRTDQYPPDFDDITQLLARRPRVTRVNSLSTMASPVAYYLSSWRRKVENIGNLNYPVEAKRTQVYGNLRLLVALLPDGSLKEVILLESSGHAILDEAAIRIVHLAAPYAPFPGELRQTTDILEIIRTWQFRKNKRLSSF